MSEQDEKLELAWEITMTEGLLRRIRFRQMFAGAETGCILKLTPQQCYMVMVLHERGSMTVRQLTQVLYVNPPAASTMVDRLVELGILTREENPEDRREVLVRVSPHHEAELQGIKRQFLQTVLDVFDKIGIEHARMWGAVCKRIQEVYVEDLKP
ncbi:MAG: MarR family transcriptional regulator [Candidatus Hydrogenedentes bacterium]|nr:MarR family transcriptional regulator [Candidatus Hydrogenedentota bacterium]